MNRDSLPNEILYLPPIARIHLSGDEYVKYSAVLDKVYNAYELQKPEIPKFVADWIEEKRPYYSLMTMVGNYLNGFGMPERVEEWIIDNKEDYLKALVNGFEIQKEPVWVVLKDAQYFHAFTGEYDKFEGFEYVLSMYEGNAHTFADKQKAEAVATLVDGVVKEWSE